MNCYLYAVFQKDGGEKRSVINELEHTVWSLACECNVKTVRDVNRPVLQQAGYDFAVSCHRILTAQR